MKKLLVLLFFVVGISAAHAQTSYSDSHNNTINYVTSSGTVEDSHHNTIGYIKSDGTIEDEHHNSIGYIKSDGAVEDSHHSTIGHSSDSREKTAMEYFFFKK